MVSLTCFNGRFTPNWQMSVLTAFAILLFLRLGVWQLQRAAEKKQMLGTEKSLSANAAIAWQPGDKLPVQYQRIKVQGQYLPTVLLFDNQHHDHQFGYHVLSPLLLANKQVVIMDRGWVAGERTRQSLPVVETPRRQQTLTGSTYFPSAKNWLLGPVLEKKQADLAIIELLDTKAISQFLHKSVYPFIIRLSKDEGDGYIRDWAIVSMPVQRHYAYAVQWFSIALVIFILFVALNFKKKNEN